MNHPTSPATTAPPKGSTKSAGTYPSRRAALRAAGRLEHKVVDGSWIDTATAAAALKESFGAGGGELLVDAKEVLVEHSFWGGGIARGVVVNRPGSPETLVCPGFCGVILRPLGHATAGEQWSASTATKSGRPGRRAVVCPTRGSQSCARRRAQARSRAHDPTHDPDRSRLSGSAGAPLA